jgi:hypothetical protein
MLLKQLYLELEEMVLNIYYEVTIILIYNPDTDRIEKEN